MILDFKEIPEANTGSGLQDTFELFARDFLAYLGYRIVEDPNRGPDGKKDLIVEEVLSGIASEQKIRWLVSCKHFAHTGKAVSDKDETYLHERLNVHHCDGFMGFYSTIASSGFGLLLSGLNRAVVFDHEKIESYLLRDIYGMRIAARYFPLSFKNYQLENPLPAQLYDRFEPLLCEFCGKNLFEDAGMGMYSQYRLDPCYDEEGEPQQKDRNIKKIVLSCKKGCDKKLEYLNKQQGYQEAGWWELEDLCVPTIWIDRMMSFVNRIYYVKDIDEKAFDKMKQIFIASFQYVARHLTSKEKERVASLVKWELL